MKVYIIFTLWLTFVDLNRMKFPETTIPEIKAPRNAICYIFRNDYYSTRSSTFFEELSSWGIAEEAK